MVVLKECNKVAFDFLSDPTALVIGEHYAFGGGLFRDFTAGAVVAYGG